MLLSLKKEIRTSFRGQAIAKMVGKAKAGTGVSRSGLVYCGFNLMGSNGWFRCCHFFCCTFLSLVKKHVLSQNIVNVNFPSLYTIKHSYAAAISIASGFFIKTI